MRNRISFFALAAAIVALPIGLAGCPNGGGEGGEGGGGGAAKKSIHLPMRTDGPKSLDPVQGSTVYDNRACSMVYDTLLQYKYLVRPFTLEPNLVEAMPTVSADGLTYTFKLKKGVRFHDDGCFPDGKGREVVAGDVFYSWKRLADEDNKPKSWWLVEDTIVGFDEFKAAQNAAETFDYDAPVEGFKTIDDQTFSVTLKKPVVRFLWLMSMFQLSVVPHEAVEKYGNKFGRHPVGTGPFTMEEDAWVAGKSMVFQKNPTYRDDHYPSADEITDPKDRARGLHEPAGTKLPIVDEVRFTMFVEDQPMWLQFESREIGYTQVPAEYFPQAFVKLTKQLKPEYADKGVQFHSEMLLDFIFRGFNMEDELLGGWDPESRTYDPKKRKLRQAISMAISWEEFNTTFYNGLNVVYDGMIPPGLDGHPADGKAGASYRGPDIERAKKLMVEAGYPNGEGLPTIDYYVNRGGNSPEQAELFARQLKKIGVEINVKLVDFSTLIQTVDNKKAGFFSFAWSSDYPDGENNLALFYGPNEAPSANHFNYKNDEYDKLYEKILSMPSSPERTKIYEQMRDMVLEDAPYCGSMGRERFYIINPWLKNFRPSEQFYTWVKYLDVDDSTRP